MRFGLLGPAGGDVVRFREAAEFLLNDCGADQVVYLGDDDTGSQVVKAWAEEIMQGPADEASFLIRAAQAAVAEDAAGLHALLARDREVAQLSAVRCLPPPPARAVELLDDRVVLFVHDKAMLDAEDIENASLIVYGRADAFQLNHFGPRAFFTPGPLDARQVTILERAEAGNLQLLRFDPQTGEPLGRDSLTKAQTRMVVLP